MSEELGTSWEKKRKEKKKKKNRKNRWIFSFSFLFFLSVFLLLIAATPRVFQKKKDMADPPRINYAVS